MNDATFKVNDRVRKVRHAYGVTFDGNVATVVRVGKRKVTLDDGSEWNVNGIAWGAKPLSHAWRIEPVPTNASSPTTS